MRKALLFLIIVVISIQIDISTVQAGKPMKSEKRKEKNAIEGDLRTWPQPFVRILNVSFESRKESDYALSLQNDEGKTVYTDSFSATNGMINKSFSGLYRLRHGIYTLSLIDGNNNIVQKTEVEH